MTPSVSISFVTYNSASCLDAFFRSLEAQSDIAWEAHAVDNASSDASCQAIQAWGRATLDRNATNIGYGRAQNQQLGRMRGDYILFANPDLSFDYGFLAALVAELKANPKVAILGPGLSERQCDLPPNRRYLGEELLPLPNPVQGPGYAWVHGSCFLMRRHVFEDLGGFDPDYFLYAEEVDLCLRARRAGWQIAWTPAVQAVHGGQQSQRQDTPYALKQREFAGTMIFWRKHFGPRHLRSMIAYEYAALRIRLAFSIVPPGRRAEFQARLDSCAAWIGANGWTIPWRILGNKLLSAAAIG